MNIFSKKLSLPTIIGIVSVAILVGSGLAIVVAPIWSNVTSTNVTRETWSGDVVLTVGSVNYHLGDSFSLSAELKPKPTLYQNQQNITYYYSLWSNISSSTPITTNPSLGMVDMGTVKTIAGIGSVTSAQVFTEEGTYYFLAKIANPT